MKAIPPKFWMQGVILLTIFIAPSDLKAQPGGPCGCADIPDIINELNKANAVLDQLRQYEQTIKGNPTIYDPSVAPNSSGNSVQNFISNGINQSIALIENKNAKSGSGQTDGKTCKAKVEAGSPCLKSLIEKRESFNEAYCNAFKTEKNLGENVNRLYTLRTDLYLREQKEAYSREVQEILRRLSTLRKTCPLDDWFGIITVSENMQQNTTVGKETTDDTTTRSGRIWLNGDPANTLSSWSVGGKYINSKSTQGTIFCKGGLAGAKDERSLTTDFRIEFDKTGGGSLPTEVNVGEPDDDSKVFVSIQIPGVEVKASGQQIDSRNSGCPNDTFTKTAPINSNNNLDAERIQSQGSYFKADPQKIIGSETISLASIKTAGMTLTHTVTVTFTLYKFHK